MRHFDEAMQGLAYLWLLAFVSFCYLALIRSAWAAVPGGVLVCYALVNTWIFYRVYLPGIVAREVYTTLIGLWIAAILAICVTLGFVL